MGIITRIEMEAELSLRSLATALIGDLTNKYIGRVSLPGPYPLLIRLRLHSRSSLFAGARSRPSIEHDFHRLKTIRLAEHNQTIYIPHQAKVNPQAPDEESLFLMAKLKQFMDSERQ
ncbi:hypothetical protein BG015_011985, partial [Linnemannia schmuckeri]